MSKVRWFLPLLFVFALTTLPTRSAWAGTITFVAPKTWGSNRDLTPEKLNQADCLANTVLPFSVTINLPSDGARFEVWAGAGCDTVTDLGNNSSCWLVSSGVATTAFQTINILPQTIVGQSHGTEATCTTDIAGGAPQSRQLFFFVMSSANKIEASAAWDFKYDVTPPEPPTDLSAGPGEEGLILSFQASEDAQNLRGYNFYCDASILDASAGDDAACGSELLVPGEAPDKSLKCGSSTTTSEKGRADDLMNGLRYAVGASTVDTYYNTSVLSNLACGVPAPVTGFFEGYRMAGGQGGGGYCSFALPSRGTSTGFAWAVSAFAACLAFRRRQK